jgi:hypothetical protein
MVISQFIFFWFLFKGADDAAKLYEARYQERQQMIEEIAK